MRTILALAALLLAGTPALAQAPAPTHDAMMGHDQTSHTMSGHMKDHRMKGHTMKDHAMKGHAMKGHTMKSHMETSGHPAPAATP
jgi:hypothetical protein